MAKRKRKRRARSQGSPPAAGAGTPTGQTRRKPGGRRQAAPTQPEGARAPISNRERAARKQAAREAREAARRAVRRRELVRRLVTSIAVAAVVVGAFLFFTRVGGPNQIPRAAVDAATAAGCTGVQTPAQSAPGGQHLQSGESYTYGAEPATSGLHDPSPLPADPAVYTEMPPETQLVHNLEHGFVNAYYRATGDGALEQNAIDALTTWANGADHVILSPHTGLPDGVTLAMTAWNRLQTCPAGVTASQATTIAQGFDEAFECTNVAPEAAGHC